MARKNNSDKNKYRRLQNNATYKTNRMLRRLNRNLNIQKNARVASVEKH